MNAMPRISEAVIVGELNRIVELLREHASGLDRGAIGEVYRTRHSADLPPRTLQRRLERLVVEGKVSPEGEGRRTVYRLKDETGEQLPSESTPKLSARGVRLRAQVGRPIDEREPVGYEVDYLRAYKPAKTWYISKGVVSRKL